MIPTLIIPVTSSIILNKQILPIPLSLIRRPHINLINMLFPSLLIFLLSCCPLSLSILASFEPAGEESCEEEGPGEEIQVCY